MRVLHIGKYFPPFSGGLENYLRDAMVALTRCGVETAALVHRHTVSFRAAHEDITVGKDSFHVVRAGTLAKLLFTPISPAFPWHIRRLIKSFKPDVLHLHLPNPSAFWVLGSISARRIPWILHWHADVVTSSQNWHVQLFHKLYRPFERALLKRATAIVVTSEFYRDSSEPLQSWLSKCHVIPLGVDVERFESLAKTENVTVEHNDVSGDQSPGEAGTITQKKLSVLAIGRLTYYKGFRYLIEAAARAENIHVNLVGHGDLADELKNLTASLKLQDRVTLHGVLSDAELARQMTLCDCLCLPSIERTEAFGVVLLEAMYFGKATVICDVPGSGMGWIVDDGITGIKVKPADVLALAEAFTRLSEDRENLINMGRHGKEKFHQYFEIDRTMNSLIDVYQQAIRSSH